MTSFATRNYPVTFIDESARTSRLAETDGYVAADFANGMNDATSGNIGGINSGGGALYNNPTFKGGVLDGDPAKWTLLDQIGAGVARTPQNGFSIGGVGYTDKTDWPGSGGDSGVTSTQAATMVINQTQSAKDGTPALDGASTDNGDATLTTTAAGWVAGDVAQT